MIISKNMKKRKVVKFVVPVNHIVKLKENEKKDKYLDLARELKKTVEHKNDGDTNCNCALSTVTKGLLKDLEISRELQNYWIIEIGKNTEKSAGDLRRLGVIQTQRKKHQR